METKQHRRTAPNPAEGSDKVKLGDGELLLEDKTDMTFLDNLMEVIRTGAKESRFNKHQLKLLADRCGAIHRTLQMMHHTAPAPNTLSAFRSAEYLVEQHIAEGWETFLVHRFTAAELFEAARVKIRMVWSLQSTARWEAEDEAAIAKDAQSNILLMRSLDCISMPTLPVAASSTSVVRLNLANEEEVLHFYQRRCISGWKLPWQQVDSFSSSEPLAPHPILVAGGGCSSEDKQQEACASVVQNQSLTSPAGGTGTDRKYFRRPPGHESQRYSFAGLPLTCFELSNAEHISPKTLESFIVDMKCRYNWSHPNLVKCVGGFAEKFHVKSDTPYLSLGAWFEDLESKSGYVSLHELLYTRGRKYHIATAIQMVLLIADALQYAIFSSVDVSPDIVAAWSNISPARILVSTDEKATAAEVGRSKTVDRVPGMQGECHVRFLPGFHVEDAEVSRWTPPVDASNAACYALTQLLCCLLGSTVPFVECVTQDDIKRVRGGSDYQHEVVDVTTENGRIRKEQRLKAVPREEEPDSANLIPKMVPKQLQTFLGKGLARKRNPAKQRRESEERRKKDAEKQGMFANMMSKIFMAGVSVDVAEDDGPQPFTSIQHFRRDLNKLARMPGIASLNSVSPHVSKAAAGAPAPSSESVHLEEARGPYDDEGNRMAQSPLRDAENVLGPATYFTVHENEIHKGHDVGPIGDFKRCFDYGYPAQSGAGFSVSIGGGNSAGGAPNASRQPLTPPPQGRGQSAESNSPSSTTGASPNSENHEV